MVMAKRRLSLTRWAREPHAVETVRDAISVRHTVFICEHRELFHTLGDRSVDQFDQHGILTPGDLRSGRKRDVAHRPGLVMRHCRSRAARLVPVSGDNRSDRHNHDGKSDQTVEHRLHSITP
jgi:hypothetical protein